MFSQNKILVWKSFGKGSEVLDNTWVGAITWRAVSMHRGHFIRSPLSFLWMSFVLWWEEVTPEVIVSALDSLATCEMLLKAVQEQELLFAVWDPHPLWELWGSVQLRGMLQAWFAKLSLKPSCREGNWPPIQGGWSLCGEMWLWMVEGRADFHTACGEHTASGHRFNSHP